MKEILLNWIKEHYGENEASNPCYDIDLLSEYLETKVYIDKEHSKIISIRYLAELFYAYAYDEELFAESIIDGIEQYLLKSFCEDEILKKKSTHTTKELLNIAKLYGYDMSKSKLKEFFDHKQKVCLEEAKTRINEYYIDTFDEVEADFTNLAHIPLAYSTDDDNYIPIEVYADLETFRLVTVYGGIIVSEKKYDNLEKMLGPLGNLYFPELITLSDEEEQYFKEHYDEANYKIDKVAE